MERGSGAGGRGHNTAGRCVCVCGGGGEAVVAIAKPCRRQHSTAGGPCVANYENLNDGVDGTFETRELLEVPLLNC